MYTSADIHVFIRINCPSDKRHQRVVQLTDNKTTVGSSNKCAIQIPCGSELCFTVGPNYQLKVHPENTETILINGGPISEVYDLVSGDEIVIGDTVIKYQKGIPTPPDIPKNSYVMDSDLLLKELNSEGSMNWGDDVSEFDVILINPTDTA